MLMLLTETYGSQAGGPPPDQLARLQGVDDSAAKSFGSSDRDDGLKALVDGRRNRFSRWAS